MSASSSTQRSEVKGTVYLIHFKKKFHHAQHYLGWTEDTDISSRIKKHKQSGGAKILRALNQAGIDFEVVHTWSDVDRNFERKLKRKKCTPRFCPVCVENKKARQRR